MKKLTLLAALAASPAFAEQPITINFAAEVGGQAFDCNTTYHDIGASAVDAKVRDYRTYLSNVSMLTADGTAVPVVLDESIWQNGSVALLDFEDGTANCTNGTSQTNSTIQGSAPDGSYIGVSFDVGVPFEQNHADPTLAPSPLNLTSMFWNWRGGYKFLRIDFVPAERSEDGPDGWFLHLGSTMCKAASKTEAPAAPCVNPNRMTVTLDNFDPEKNTIIIDPAPVLAQAEISTNTPETSPGCMSFPNDPDCLTVMEKLGLNYMDVPAKDQQLFGTR